MFNPADLFAKYGATAGGYYEFTDASTLFTDTAGTVPVAAPGDLIALIKDKSGLGHDFTQANAANRPAYFVDPHGYGSGRFIAAHPTYMDGSVLNCDEYLVWAAYLYKATTGGRILDTRGTGAAGAVKGWFVGAADGVATLALADDGAGQYVIDNSWATLNGNVSAFIHFYNNGNSAIPAKVVTVGGDGVIMISSWPNAVKPITLGNITTSGICRMGAPINTTSTQCLDAYLYACGSIGAVVDAYDRDSLMQYLRNMANSI